MKKYFFFTGVMLGCLLFFAGVLHAEGNLGNAVGNLGTAGKQAIGPNPETNVATVVGTVINGALTLVGTIFFVLMVYAGYLWMTARGEEEQITKAKEIIRASIIGLIVVLSAYAITVFVTARFESGSCQKAPNVGSADCTPFHTQDECTAQGGACVWQ